MKKSTERKRIKRLEKDINLTFSAGLISASGWEKVQRVLNSAKRKL